MEEILLNTCILLARFRGACPVETGTLPRLRLASKLTAICLVIAMSASASSLSGRITDPLGAVVPNATVDLVQAGATIQSVAANENGEYQFSPAAKGEYQVRARAASFEPALSPVVRIGDNSHETVNLTLTISGLSESVVVTATGTPMPQAQAGASVDVLDMDPYSAKADAQDALRLVPGFQMAQIGQRGGTTQLQVRGGPSDANKVVVDGIPVNDIGGNFDFANLGTNAFQQAEIYRGPNSILYGSDALSSVIEFTSKQGSTPAPELQYSIDGGNFGQRREEVSLGGVFHQFDYFGNYVRFDTNNSIPRNRFHNSAGAINLGWTPSATTTIRATARRIVTASEQPNGLDLFAIPDDSEQREQDTFFGITLQNQTTPKWHNLLRYSGVRLRGQWADVQPTGIPYDPFDTGTPLDYTGETVTLRGANGYTVTGQGLFQYPGIYPSRYITQTNRDFLYFQSHYEVSPWLNALFGFRFEDERGNTISLPYDSVSSTARKNFSYTVQFSGGIQSRLFYTAGVGVDDNAVFGLVATPRASLAYHLIRPKPNRILSGTKLRANFGQGIKEPSIDQQANSLYGILASLPDGSSLTSQYHVSPVNAERSQTFDVGVDQMLASRIRLSANLFYNNFRDQLEFVSGEALPQLGVPLAIAEEVTNTYGGAYLNSMKYRAMGAEVEIDAKIGSRLIARAGYTYTDAVVQRSFSSDALSPSYNPLFPAIPIGVYSPLVGARPFRVAPQSGFFSLIYSGNKWTAAFTGTLIGRRDDSTFLLDKEFGNTMLLPNRNLDPAYQNIGFTGTYRINRMMALYATADNLLCERYDESFGYPSLPFNFRGGVRLTIGGESRKKP